MPTQRPLELEDVLCPVCGGAGWGISGEDWDASEWDELDSIGQESKCPRCLGTGFLFHELDELIAS